jgi:hypothetical protein
VSSEAVPRMFPKGFLWVSVTDRWARSGLF